MSALNRPLDLSTREQPMTIDMTQNRQNMFEIPSGILGGTLGSYSSGPMQQKTLTPVERIVDIFKLDLDVLLKLHEMLPAELNRKRMAAREQAERIDAALQPPPKDEPVAPEDTYDCPCRACRKPTTATR